MTFLLNAIQLQTFQIKTQTWKKTCGPGLLQVAPGCPLNLDYVGLFATPTRMWDASSTQMKKGQEGPRTPVLHQDQRINHIVHEGKGANHTLHEGRCPK